MKKSSTEQKAEAYDRALKRACEFYNNEECRVGMTPIDLESIFPELKESEDEKIRKQIISFLKEFEYDHYRNLDFSSWISWLEKQGEHKPNPYSGTSFEYNGHTWGMCARDNGVEILIDGHLKGRVFTNDNNAKEMFIKALERVEEQNSKGYKLTDCDKNSWWEDFKAYCGYTEMQKPADKVEPKLHEGDWAVSNLDKKARQISEVHFDEYNSYYVVDGKSVDLEEYDRLHHLWTIQDANDGDVLVDNNAKYPFIFKQTKLSDIKTDIKTPLTVLGYCGIGGAGFTKSDGWGDTINCTYYPATEEQRDLLFKKMKEAGYEWDAKKKELKKIGNEIETPSPDMLFILG